MQIARRAQRAALAPAQPSSQDRAVAAAAGQKAVEAQAEARSQRQEEAEGPQASEEPEEVAEQESPEENALSGSLLRRRDEAYRSVVNPRRRANGARAGDASPR
jgi:hypothetical protein